MKDIVTMCIYMIEELSLSSNLQSFPNVINEIREIMGESGEAIRKLLVWLAGAIKSLYQKLSEILSAIFRGESLDQVAKIFEELILKYDIIIKEFHVSFIKYIEHLYKKIHQMAALQVRLMMIFFWDFGRKISPTRCGLHDQYRSPGNDNGNENGDRTVC